MPKLAESYRYLALPVSRTTSGELSSSLSFFSDGLFQSWTFLSCEEMQARQAVGVVLLIDHHVTAILGAYGKPASSDRKHDQYDQVDSPRSF